MNGRLTRRSSTLALLAAVLGVLAPTAADAAATSTTAATAITARTAGLMTYRTRIGMSTPRPEWQARLAETDGVDARRIFADLGSPDGALVLAQSEVAAGRLPILSFKIPNNDWAGAANGRYDSALRGVDSRLAALPGRVFVTVHHEPAQDGTPAAYAAMQRHVLPLLSPPANVDAGLIGNGFWWSAQGMGLTDAQIAEWFPADVLTKAEVVASDTYQGGTTAAPGENAAVKIRRMSQWATRVGVSRLGIGEYNGLTAYAIKAAGDAVLADPRFVFASCFNSSVNNRPGVDWALSGDRLTAFTNTVAAARAARS